MDIVEYTTFLVKSIVKNPELVKVTSFSSDEEATIVEIIVADSDKGTVLGKNGSIVSSIRTLVQAYAYINKLGKIKINVDSF